MRFEISPELIKVDIKKIVLKETVGDVSQTAFSFPQALNLFLKCKNTFKIIILVLIAKSKSMSCAV